MCGADPQVLPTGDTTDKGLDRLQVAIKQMLQLEPVDYGLKKTNNLRTWLEDVLELLDHQKNSGGYRLCQDAIVSRGAIGVLLGLASKAISDGIRMVSLNILASLVFGNEGAANAVIGHQDFLPVLTSTLHQASCPEKLVALRLSHSVMASSAPLAVEVTPILAQEVAPSLSDPSFQVIPRAALDALISASFHAPSAVMGALPDGFLVSIFAEDAHPPSWLALDSLQTLVNGFLATNLVYERAFNHQDRQKVLLGMLHGQFLLHLASALDAAAVRREWPTDSGVFHAPSRIVGLVKKLSTCVDHRKMAVMIGPLARIVEEGNDDNVIRMALGVLRTLCSDVGCLDELLPLQSFRSTLEILHKAGDEPNATGLASHLAFADSFYSAAQDAFNECQSYCKNVPDVRVLALAFNSAAPIEGELNPDELVKVLALVPVGPSSSIRATISGPSAHSFSFQAFAERVYGLPTLLGWWPSLMEDTAVMWCNPSLRPVELLPELRDFVEVFEHSAKGNSGVHGLVIFEEILPALDLPTQGLAVEEAFTEIRGDGLLSLADFASWLCKLCRALQDEASDKMIHAA